MEARRDGGTEIVEGTPTFTINTLLVVRDDPIYTIYARQLIELMCDQSSVQLPLLLCLGLKKSKDEKSTFKKIYQLVSQNKIW